jgi:hypothetical protein
VDAADDDPDDGRSTRPGRRPRRLTGWLVTWPAATLLNVVYALLVEHASQEQIDQINEQLDAGFDTSDPDEVADILARGIALESDDD